MQAALRLLILSIALAATSVAPAQDGKISVAVDHSGSDTVGQRLVFAVREAIRASSGYKLVSGKEAILHISLVTLDPERSPSASGYWTAAAVAYTMRNDLPLNKADPQTWYPIYLTTNIVLAGMSRVDDQAKGILATLDAQVEQYRQDMHSR